MLLRTELLDTCEDAAGLVTRVHQPPGVRRASDLSLGRGPALTSSQSDHHLPVLLNHLPAAGDHVVKERSVSVYLHLATDMREHEDYPRER